jgi:chemotaxis protein histidine kinase CheA
MIDQQFQQRLRAIFSEEAREHLAQIDAALVALEQADEPQRVPFIEQAMKALHTLKGAARAVDERELERLCHALESVLVATRESRAPASAEQFDGMHLAAGAAREAVDAPGPRSSTPSRSSCRRGRAACPCPRRPCRRKRRRRPFTTMPGRRRALPARRRNRTRNRARNRARNRTESRA